MAAGAAALFEARFSILKLLGWVLLAAHFAAFSAVMLATRRPEPSLPFG